MSDVWGFRDLTPEELDELGHAISEFFFRADRDQSAEVGQALLRLRDMADEFKGLIAENARLREKLARCEARP